MDVGAARLWSMREESRLQADCGGAGSFLPQMQVCANISGSGAGPRRKNRARRHSWSCTIRPWRRFAAAGRLRLPICGASLESVSGRRKCMARESWLRWSATATVLGQRQFRRKRPRPRWKLCVCWPRDAASKTSHRIRGRQVATVVNAVANLVERGDLEFQPAWIDRNKQAVIEAACAKLGLEWLKPLKDALPPEVTYDEIRLVVARLRREQNRSKAGIPA